MTRSIEPWEVSSPGTVLTGRTLANSSSSLRRRTLADTWPVPMGVVVGPLSATPQSRTCSTVAEGRASPQRSKATSPMSALHPVDVHPRSIQHNARALGDFGTDAIARKKDDAVGHGSLLWEGTGKGKGLSVDSVLGTDGHRSVRGIPPNAAQSPRMRRALRLLCVLTGIGAAVGVGIVAGALGWAHLPEPHLGIVVGVMAGIVAFAIVQKLWGTRVGRVLLVLAIAGHVAYWSSQGWRAMGGPGADGGRGSADRPRLGGGCALRCGTRPRSLRPAPENAARGVGERPSSQGASPRLRDWDRWGRSACASWGLRRVRRACHGARCSPRRPRGPSAMIPSVRALWSFVRPPWRTSTVALVAVDTVTVDRPVVDAIHRRVRDLGIARQALVVAASHTHSGPGGYSKAAAGPGVGNGPLPPRGVRGDRDGGRQRDPIRARAGPSCQGGDPPIAWTMGRWR